MADGLSRWIERGFVGELARLSARRQVGWRFWAGGGELLAFGVMVNSFDSIGRPYPLLVMGQQRLPGWGERWELVPRALQQAWQDMDGLCRGEFPDVAALEARLSSLARGGVPALGEAPLEKETAAAAGLAREEGVVSVPLGQEWGEEGLAPLHAAVKGRWSAAPSAVFAGGASQQSVVHFFYRPLDSADFASLWRGEGGEDEDL